MFVVKRRRGNAKADDPWRGKSREELLAIPSLPNINELLRVARSARRGCVTSPDIQKLSKFRMTFAVPSLAGRMEPLADAQLRSGPRATCTCETVSPLALNS